MSALPVLGRRRARPARPARAPRTGRRRRCRARRRAPARRCPSAAARRAGRSRRPPAATSRRARASSRRGERGRRRRVVQSRAARTTSRPEVALAAHGRLAGVQAHAHADVDAARPVVLGVGALRLDGCRDGVAGAGKGEEEGVALRVDLDAAERREVLPHQPAVLGEHARRNGRRAASASAVEPSTSLKTNVTVPLGRPGMRPSMRAAWQAREREPARRRDQPVPAPARRQPRRLVPVGRGGARRAPATRTSRSCSRSATPPATGAT